MNSFKINPIIKSIRNDYDKHSLSKESVDKNPFHQFELWLFEAIDSGDDHAHAMALSTVDESLMPDGRIVLLRNVSYGGFTFFTNYESKKGKDLEKNNKASLLFFWTGLERQVRILGEIIKLPAEESDTYFESRPFDSKVGAWVSQQSELVANRSALEKSFEEKLRSFENKEVPRPANWGGYVLIPSKIEFWQGRPNRLHDRILYTLDSNKKSWKIDRLMP
jgi:pyridoxamine 5'-phosphate oxidase